MLKTKIKASSITNLTDARYFAAWGVDWMGFNFDPGSDQQVSPKTMIAIKEWIDGVKMVGEFNLHTAEEIKEAIELLGLDAVQLSMFSELSTVMELGEDITVIREIIVENDATLDSLKDKMEYFAPYTQLFLLDFIKSGIQWSAIQKGEPFSTEGLAELVGSFPVLLNIDLNQENVLEIIAKLPINGINLIGGEEEKVGFKSFDELDEILEALEE